MSTRSVVGCAENSGGVYVHWDGYPQARLLVLREIAMRDGVEKMREVISGKNWSYLDPYANKNREKDIERASGVNDSTCIVDGYGLPYDETRSFLGFADEEYGYAIHSNGDVDVYVGPGNMRKVNLFDSDLVQQAEDIERYANFCNRLDWEE